MIATRLGVPNGLAFAQVAPRHEEKADGKLSRWDTPELIDVVLLGLSIGLGRLRVAIEGELGPVDSRSIFLTCATRPPAGKGWYHTSGT